MRAWSLVVVACAAYFFISIIEAGALLKRGIAFDVEKPFVVSGIVCACWAGLAGLHGLIDNFEDERETKAEDLDLKNGEEL